MNQMPTLKFGMGASPRRVEDGSLIRGLGRYTTDVTPAGALTAYVVRSAAGHARIRVGDLSAARSANGVHLVWTAQDVGDLGLMPCLAKPEAKAPIEEPPFPVLCGDVVRHVGDAIAFIVADDLNSAKSAAELIEIDYDTLPAVVDTATALDPGAPLVWPERGSNLAFESEVGNKAAADAAFAAAAQVAELTIVNNRLVCNYMEPRAIVAEYDSATGKYVVTVGSQGVHGIRDAMCKVLKIDPSEMRVLTFDVGGGFGTKTFNYREYPLAVRAARALGRPVKWVSDRNEHFLADAHGRDNICRGAFALDRDGRVLGMRVELIAAMGSYLNQFGPFIPALGLTMLTGPYDIQAAHASLKAVFTNTVPTDAYRGAGRPEATYFIERLMDEAARVTGLSRTEIRRRNFIRPEQMPYKTPTDRTYDTAEFAAHMDKALQVAGADSFEARLSESRSRGKVRGLGFATYVEVCAFGNSEPAKAVLEQDGSVSLHIGTQSNGQGHQTAYAQFVAEPLGLDYDRIRVVQGDTDALAKGGGTGGSRSIPLGVVSVDAASRQLARQIKELAADELEAGTGDIELAGGAARVVGTDRAVSYADIAQRASDRSKLTAEADVRQEENTYPNGTHVCEIEIDPETGQTAIVNYTIVDDFGVTVNPMLLAGQVHGGVAQGVGQALLEHTVYDDTGQLVTATFNDYTMPRAWDLPFIDFQTRNIPSTWNPLGIKGAGEAGTIGSAPAVMNAVQDALRRAFNVRHIDMPATPRRIWETIQAAGTARAA
jgi:carbon-monoxide dehydrogenase large subunit